MCEAFRNLDPRQPVLIAGPTASGKSALALDLAQREGGVIVNADAVQVYADWRILTARPDARDEALVPHLLYGHVPGHKTTSVGDWLRALAPILAGRDRPIIVGGTGLYLSALTEGLVEVPPIPQDIHETAMMRSAEAGGREALFLELDAATQERIDRLNPMRVQRAWEVLRATGRGLASWQDDTPPPLLPLEVTQAFVVDAPKDWLTPRIERRFAQMLDNDVLDEARANAPGWSPQRPSAKAIGAAELIAHVSGEMSLDEASDRVTTATRQFAKRQRTWFRARMRAWRSLHPEMCTT